MKKNKGPLMVNPNCEHKASSIKEYTVRKETHHMHVTECKDCGFRRDIPESIK